MHYELSVAARVALAREYEDKFQIMYENTDFIPPLDGGIWLRYDYVDADTMFLSLDRKCKSYIGMVQIGVNFSPGSGVDKARKISKEIAEFFYDGKMLDTGYISEGAITHKLQKSETGWFYPIRFYVRFDGK